MAESLMKQSLSNPKKQSTPPVEPVFLSRLQRQTAEQIAQAQARAKRRQRAGRLLVQAVIAAVVLRVLTVAMQPCLAAYRSARDLRVLQTQMNREALRNQH